jgi:hypothetical protein
MNNMILEMSDYPVRRVRFGKQLSYESGDLEIDRAALNELLLENPPHRIRRLRNRRARRVV